MGFTFFLFLCLGVTVSFGSPPTFAELRKYTAYSYAAACREGLDNWTCYWCTVLPHSVTPPVKVVTVFESNGLLGTYGYVGYSTEEIIVAFRGSSSVQNWLHDFDIIKDTWPGAPGAEIHQGFYTAYLEVEKTVESFVTQLVQQFPNLPLTITGHSLGAALSVVSAMELIQNKVVDGAKIRVINLGQPRVGNDVFAHFFDANVGYHYRMVNQRDLVPHLPPMAFGFYHVGTEIWFPTNTTSFVVCNGSGEDPKCSDSLHSFQIEDHLNYTGLSSWAGKVCCQCGGQIIGQVDL